VVPRVVISIAPPEDDFPAFKMSTAVLLLPVYIMNASGAMVKTLPASSMMSMRLNLSPLASQLIRTVQVTMQVSAFPHAGILTTWASSIGYQNPTRLGFFDLD